MNDVRDRLGVLCDQLTRHRTMAAEIEAAGAGPQLEELLGLLPTAPDASGAPASTARLGALLDAIEDACARHGLADLDVRGLEHLRSADARLPPGFALTPGGTPAAGADPVDAWVCPWSHCGRVVFPEEATARPACAAGGTPLRAYPPR
ncbi:MULTISPECIES: hypothetical protein [Streptomyces]|uniref:Uncharacterized protein n=1 Tax=Streptomyces odorifer TaxID=53450 RepID=A0A7Y6EZZ1_9ACTN|nr:MULTISPECIES: hypothetical protein [Streptomyces]NUV36151.1 hypothetical protein [Streptomyces sp. KAI-27]NUV50372.1 hypothetical protein [Streptomyces sp. CAI-78]MBV1956631.1 hypothetical protein [Streptomyces sp. BV333]MCG5120898.1 hypothetical protein [Streptomyces sp. T7(2022)]MCQ9706966.1 hypothetical protein [Streptomyces sp. BSP1]